MRKITEAELKTILDDHKTWVESDGTKGSRGNLDYVDFAGFDFREFRMKFNYEFISLHDLSCRGADFSQAQQLWFFMYLNEIDFSGANFSGVKDIYACRGSNFSNANLSGTVIYGMSDSIMEGANLSDAKIKADISGCDFRNANMTRTTFSRECRMIWRTTFVGAVGLKLPERLIKDTLDHGVRIDGYDEKMYQLKQEYEAKIRAIRLEQKAASVRTTT